MGQMRDHPHRTERDMQSLRSPAVVKSQCHDRPARAEGLKAEGGGMREATSGSERRQRGARARVCWGGVPRVVTLSRLRALSGRGTLEAGQSERASP